MTSMKVVIDYGIGNVSLIRNMLKKKVVNAVLVSKVDDIQTADKLILPVLVPLMLKCRS